jgi:plasmid stabilization system protein ParE
MAAKLVVHPAFYRRLRHYRDRIRLHDGRPQVARQCVSAAERLILQLVENAGRGHSARFESPELADILRVAVPGFSVFAVFYRWNGETLTLITLEHTAQDLPPRLASIISAGLG